MVSASDKITRTLSGAFAKSNICHEGPKDVWIALIHVPQTGTLSAYYSAKDLAEEAGFGNADYFRSEYLFDWEIEEKYVEHIVSLQTLIERGIGRYIDLEIMGMSSLQQRLEERIRLLDGFESGLYFARIAQCFGARAPVSGIAHQLLFEAEIKGY